MRVPVFDFDTLLLSALASRGVPLGALSTVPSLEAQYKLSVQKARAHAHLHLDLYAKHLMCRANGTPTSPTDYIVHWTLDTAGFGSKKCTHHTSHLASATLG